jgi:hypothetical protein
MWETIVGFWPMLTAVLAVLLATTVSLHVVVKKKDSRSAIAWMGLIWLVPLLGSFLYLVFGINRITMRATRPRAVGAASASSRSPPTCRRGASTWSRWPGSWSRSALTR